MHQGLNSSFLFGCMYPFGKFGLGKIPSLTLIAGNNNFSLPIVALVDILHGLPLLLLHSWVEPLLHRHVFICLPCKVPNISYNFSSLAYLVQLPVSNSYFIPNVFPCFISSGWFCYPFSRCNSEYYSGHVPTLQSSHSRGVHQTYERWSTSEWRLLLRCTDMHWDEAIDALSCVFLVTTPIRHREHDVIFPVP